MLRVKSNYTIGSVLLMSLIAFILYVKTSGIERDSCSMPAQLSKSNIANLIFQNEKKEWEKLGITVEKLTEGTKITSARTGVMVTDHPFDKYIDVEVSLSECRVPLLRGTLFVNCQGRQENKPSFVSLCMEVD